MVEVYPLAEYLGCACATTRSEVVRVLPWLPHARTYSYDRCFQL